MHDHHSPAHAHDHAHAPASFGFAFALGAALNIGFVIVEVVFGVLSGSAALLADAAHNLSDVLGLLVAWGAATLSRRAPNQRYTYGLRGSSILAALFNAVFLLVAAGAIALEAVERIWDPRPIGGVTVIVVAAVGILINGATALMRRRPARSRPRRWSSSRRHITVMGIGYARVRAHAFRPLRHLLHAAARIPARPLRCAGARL